MKTVKTVIGYITMVILTVAIIGGGYYTTWKYFDEKTSRTDGQEGSVDIKTAEVGRLESLILTMPWENTDKGKFSYTEAVETDSIVMEEIEQTIPFPMKLEMVIRYRHEDEMSLYGTKEANGLHIAFSRNYKEFAYEYPVEIEEQSVAEDYLNNLKEQEKDFSSKLYEPIRKLQNPLRNLRLEVFFTQQDNLQQYCLGLQKEFFLYNGEICVLFYQEDFCYILIKYSGSEYRPYYFRVAAWPEI